MNTFSSIIITMIMIAWSTGVVELAEPFKLEMAVPETIQVKFLVLEAIPCTHK